MASISSTSEHHDRAATDAHTTAQSAGRRWLAGAAVGALAALAASGVMLWAGRAWGGAILAQLLSERIIEVTPLAVFRAVLSELESDAKAVTLVGLTLLQVLGGAALGALYARRVARSSAVPRLPGALTLALLVWFFLGLAASPLGEIGLFARDAQNPGATQLAFALAALTFGALTALLVPWPRERTETDPSRRRFVQVAGATAVAVPALLATGYIGRHVQRLRTTFEPELATVTEDGGGDFNFAGMPEEITPTDAFYVVSKNFVDPEVDASGWSLEIGGLVERPMSLSYTDIMLRDSVDLTATLECISNGVGGPYISNATWQGFPLADLLNEAGLKPGIVDLELHAADGYVESIPIEKAMDDVMLVHTMNGEPLTPGHGYPARLIVPGIYGMKNVKWVTAMNAVGEDIQGYWQERGWSDVATMLTMSRIDVPETGYKATVGETVRIGGVAFGGDKSISRVELSIDDGQTWNDAKLSEPLSPLAWRLWSYEYVADEPGKRQLVVRATNGAGELQEEERSKALPDGSTGWDRVEFEVV